MAKSKRKRIVAAIVVAAVVTTTLGAGTASADRGSVAWRSCGTRGAECATISVPLDWARPTGDRVSLAVTRLRATDPKRRLGVLLFNPGGPGGPGVPVVRDFGPDVFPRELQERFDIIGLDPRGVGESTPAITCPVPPTSSKVTQFPRDRADYDRLVAYNKQVADSCRAATGPLIDHVDTVSAARDIDAVRVSLGEQRINWLGLSYGTLLGATYAQLYPNRLRAAVLDGAVDHTVGTRRLAFDEIRSTEDVFGKFFAWCAAEVSCAMHGRDIAGEYRALLDRADRAPVPATGVPDGLNAEQIGYTAYSLVSIQSLWPILATAIRDAATDAAGFVGEGSSAAYRVIGCHDFPSDVRGYADLAERQRAARQIAPTTRGYVEGWDVQAGCAGWPIKAANPWGPTPVRGAPPILVVTGRHDPATPYPWGLGLACQISGSRVLTWSGAGHTAFLNDPDALRSEVEYLLNP
ncbi:alpha/beta hydrolase [Actinokineospora enzanensis]|uniref:alpha/beta hydrolase n=1 Tax=Actinokineospora enzanensis TaxID=155975 RepID=UPI00036682F5|nr:alpha/beta hydrolase [Actinokineospora enzanensis]